MIPCLVLNASLQPLSVVSATRGLVLVLEGRASLKEQHPTKMFHSVREAFPVPTTIVLKEYTVTGAGYHGPAQLNQRNLFIRDNHTCVYCGRHVVELNYDKDMGEVEYLTRDHVQPTSKGGQDEWTNVVTACSTCNHAKCSLLPNEIEGRAFHYEELLWKLQNETNPATWEQQQLDRKLHDATYKVVSLAEAIANVEKDFKLWQGLARPVEPREAAVSEILQKRQKKFGGERAA